MNPVRLIHQHQEFAIIATLITIILGVISLRRFSRSNVHLAAKFGVLLISFIPGPILTMLSSIQPNGWTVTGVPILWGAFEPKDGTYIDYVFPPFAFVNFLFGIGVTFIVADYFIKYRARHIPPTEKNIDESHA